MLQALLSNIQAFARQKSLKQKTINKEPYFDRKWGDNTAFQRTVDRLSYQNEAGDPSAEIRDQILLLLKTKTEEPSARNEFLKRMQAESADFIQERNESLLRERAEEIFCRDSMEQLLEQIFEILRAYAYELNNALGYGPLHVAATSPQTVCEVLKYTVSRQADESVTYRRARLSTPSYSLVLRGDSRGIKFFLMPVERTLGLSKQELQFLPIMSLELKLVNGKASWHTGTFASAITENKLEYLCMTLFQSLIDKSKAAAKVECDTQTEEIQPKAV